MPKIKLTVEYNGAAFHGWQIQPGVRTIQAEMQRVIEMVLRCAVSHLEASGRTDAGVHARGQVVCVTVDVEPDLAVFRKSISALLPNEISVLSAESVPETFDPCRHAVAKQYTYQILNRDVPAVLDYGHVWHVPWKLDHSRLRQEAEMITGIHDFQSFRGSGCEAKTSVREIYESEFSFAGDSLTYRVVGKGFLKQMVRNLVGTMVDLASGRLKDKTMTSILAARDRRVAGVTAPAHGLCLDWVRYQENEES